MSKIFFSLSISEDLDEEMNFVTEDDEDSYKDEL